VSTTQYRAFKALWFFYREIIHNERGNYIDAVRDKMPRCLPTVMTQDKVAIVSCSLDGSSQLAAKLLYKSGLYLMVLKLVSRILFFTTGSTISVPLLQVVTNNLVEPFCALVSNLKCTLFLCNDGRGDVMIPSWMSSFECPRRN